MKKQNGYFLVSVGRKGTWTFYLWSEDIQDLQQNVKGKRFIVPNYEDGDKCYIKHNDTFFRYK